MSADNGIYIAKFPDGFRVCEGQAIENVDYYPEGSDRRKIALKSYFWVSPVFKTKEEATIYASKLEDEILSSEFGILEYEIRYIGEYESFEEEE